MHHFRTRILKIKLEKDLWWPVLHRSWLWLRWNEDILYSKWRRVDGECRSHDDKLRVADADADADADDDGEIISEIIY